MNRSGCSTFVILLAAFLSVMLAGSAGADEPRSWDERYREEPHVTLLQEETVELRKDFTTVTRVHMVKKIQKESAKDLGEITLDYDKSREIVSDIQAFTVTPDGRRLPFQKIQDLTHDRSYAIYSDSMEKVISMPQVVVGSTIDWQAAIETTRPVIEKNFFDTVTFTSTVPVKLQRYTLIVPRDITLHINYINTDKKPVITEHGDTVVYVWEVREQDKLEPEPYMPPREEVAEIVTISTLNSWEDMSRWAWGLFSKNIRLTDPMKRKVQEITDHKKTMAEKIQSIVEYIQEDFRYVAMNMDFHSYEPHPADEIFKNGYGDCKDHTLLGMAMLSEIGVTAYPVLFPASRGFSRDKLLPMPTYFNHAILYFEVDGKRYYTDLLRKGYYFYEVPDDMANKNVLVLNGQGGMFGQLPPFDEAEAYELSEERAVIAEDGSASVELTSTFSRRLSINFREEYKNMSDDTRKQMFAYFEAGLAPGGKVLEHHWLNIDTPHQQISVQLKYISRSKAQKIGNMLMFGLPQRPRGTLFAPDKRKYPIVFSLPHRQEGRVAYEIPEGYEVVNLPKEIKLDRPFAGYERSYRIEGRTITGKDIFVYKESITPPDQYQAIRDFYDDITRLTNDMIMIRKKG